MKSQTKLAAASLMFATLVGAAGCSPDVEKSDPVAAQAPAANADIHPFKVGALDVVALRDGGMTGVPNDNTVLGVGRTPAEVAAVLTANGLPGDSFSLSVQPLLVRDGARVVLLDAGAGNSFGPGAGKLPASLAAAGVQPDQVTDVLISHSHGDHVVGLVNASGGLTFPNATIRMAAAEWEFLKANAQMGALVTTITPKVQTFEPGAAALTPSISSVAINGHTPGHMGYEIRSGTDSLLYIGDTMHHSVISVQRPEWQIAFDNDAPTATASRAALLERAAAGNLRVYAVHFPFPGLGRFQRRDDGFVWVPEAAARP
ncbi:MBL fold metallo-hydrolase [Brevundimonas sp. UBA2416]|uniref:MBL fold metallo-hydrolase n=1 Tax=Brevundimonas sp. UBA2416 TaxID=1946124 RepID=UPI0025BE7935|nr:MBL fold metallo-hydrolase [Brevundimonas sp. UBA2416]HRJ62850.1 MBL fold metallo-hydrolase [Brevundimonas sp.]